MLSSENFSEYYKTISNTELLAILQNPEDYQPAAVEAAQKEFAVRLLSETDINEAKKEITEKSLQKEKEKEKIKAIETRIKKNGTTFFDTLNPILTGIPTTEKLIRLIVIVFGGLFIYELIAGYRTHITFLEDFNLSPFHTILYFLPLIFTGVGVFTFWKRKRIGWILLAALFVFSIATFLWALVQAILWQPSGLEGWDNLFPRPAIPPLILQLAFYGGAVYCICKQGIRDVFQISKDKMITILIFSSIASVLLLFGAFF